MSEKLQRHGALPGTLNPLKKLIFKLAGKNYHVFPVPGLSILMAKGFDPRQPGISIVPTPRHANVLLVAPPVTLRLCRYAAVAYAQMPRPRMLVFLDMEKAEPLPGPDIIIHKEDLGRLTSAMRDLDLWQEDAEPYAPGFLEKATSDGKENNHHEHKHEGHGHGKKQKEEDNHHGDPHQENHGEQHQHKHKGHEEDHDKQNEHGGDHDGHGKEHEGHNGHGGDHGGHEGHDGMGFMSMVEMTKNMPRSMDGLPMEMNEARFGPFFPGLPDGMRIKMMLDGDTVMKAEYEKGLLCRHLDHHFPEDPDKFPEHLMGLNPLLPHTYCILAKKALAAASGRKYKVTVADLEEERIIAHLVWLYQLFSIMGDNSMQHETSRMILGFKSNSLNQKIAGYTGWVRKRIYLKKRLTRVAHIPDEHLVHFTGPVARAAGKRLDSRMEDPLYAGFEPVTVDENNAWGQLLVRLGEIRQSAALMNENIKDHELPVEKNRPGKGSISGKTSIETPSGKASLDLNIQDGKLESFKLHTPAVPLAAMIPQLTGGLELSDALLTIAALGISPWEIDR